MTDPSVDLLAILPRTLPVLLLERRASLGMVSVCRLLARDDTDLPVPLRGDGHGGGLGAPNDRKPEEHDVVQ
jgi:hypothetical protein